MRMSSRYIDPSIDSLDELPTAADKIPYSTAADTWAEADLSAFMRTVLDDANAAAVLATIGGAALASPTFTGTPAAPTAAADTSTTQIATTAYVQGELTDRAPLASPTFTGTPAAPSAAAGTTTTQLATTAFVTTTHGHRYQIPATWFRVNIARSLTDETLEKHKGNAVLSDAWRAPRAGSIVALTTRIAVDITTGSLTVKVAKNGDAGTLSVASTPGSNAGGGTSTQAIGVDTFVAGDMIGAEITTDGTLVPNGTDSVEVCIEVQEAGT